MADGEEILGAEPGEKQTERHRMQLGSIVKVDGRYPVDFPKRDNPAVLEPCPCPHCHGTWLEVLGPISSEDPLSMLV